MSLSPTAFNVAISVTNDEQHIVLFNEAAERVFQIPSAQVLGCPLGALLPQDSRAVHERQVRGFGRDGRRSRRMGEHRRIQGRRGDGVLFDAEASVARLDLQGRAFYAAIVRDASERTAAEREFDHARSQAEAALLAKDAPVARRCGL